MVALLLLFLSPCHHLSLKIKKIYERLLLRAAGSGSDSGGGDGGGLFLG